MCDIEVSFRSGNAPKEIRLGGVCNEATTKDFTFLSKVQSGMISEMLEAGLIIRDEKQWN